MGRMTPKYLGAMIPRRIGTADHYHCDQECRFLRDGVYITELFDYIESGVLNKKFFESLRTPTASKITTPHTLQAKNAA